MLVIARVVSQQKQLSNGSEVLFFIQVSMLLPVYPFVYLDILNFILVLRRANSENIQQKELKLTLLRTHSDSDDDISIGEVNGAIHEQTTSARQTLSTGCLVDTTLGYSTSARITDHFPQKILTPSPSSIGQRNEQQRISRLKLTADVRAPVATAEEPTSPELDDIDGSEANSQLSDGSESGELGTSNSEIVQSRPSSEERSIQVV